MQQQQPMPRPASSSSSYAIQPTLLHQRPPSSNHPDPSRQSQPSYSTYTSSHPHHIDGRFAMSGSSRDQLDQLSASGFGAPVQSSFHPSSGAWGGGGAIGPGVGGDERGTMSSSQGVMPQGFEGGGGGGSRPNTSTAAAALALLSQSSSIPQQLASVGLGGMAGAQFGVEETGQIRASNGWQQHQPNQAYSNSNAHGSFQQQYDPSPYQHQRNISFPQHLQALGRYPTTSDGRPGSASGRPSSSHAQMNGSLEYAQAQQIALLQAHGQLPQSPASLHNARPTSSSGRPPSSHGRPSSSSGRLHPQQHFAHPSSQFVSLPSSASSSTSPFSWSAPNNQPPPPPPPPRHDSPRSHPYAPSGSRPRLISSRGVRGESGGITTRGIASGLETADFSRGVGGFEQMPLQTSIDPAGIRPQTSDGYSLGYFQHQQQQVPNLNTSNPFSIFEPSFQQGSFQPSPSDNDLFTPLHQIPQTFNSMSQHDPNPHNRTFTSISPSFNPDSFPHYPSATLQPQQLIRPMTSPSLAEMSSSLNSQPQNGHHYEPAPKPKAKSSSKSAGVTADGQEISAVTGKPKRPRRKAEEVERDYACNFEDCTKSYSTLNHLNTHILSQSHGSKRLPAEFKEIRKQRRKERKEAIKLDPSKRKPRRPSKNAGTSKAKKGKATAASTSNEASTSNGDGPSTRPTSSGAGSARRKSNAGRSSNAGEDESGSDGEDFEEDGEGEDEEDEDEGSADEYKPVKSRSRTDSALSLQSVPEEEREEPERDEQGKDEQQGLGESAEVESPPFASSISTGHHAPSFDPLNNSNGINHLPIPSSFYPSSDRFIHPPSSQNHTLNHQINHTYNLPGPLDAAFSFPSSPNAFTPAEGSGSNRFHTFAPFDWTVASQVASAATTPGAEDISTPFAHHPPPLPPTETSAPGGSSQYLGGFPYGGGGGAGSGAYDHLQDYVDTGGRAR